MKLKAKPITGLDNPKWWNRRLKPAFDVQAYQARIDKAIGVNKDGKSIIRLVWAQDVNTHAYGETLPRYWTRRRRLPADKGYEYEYWRVARWVFERRVEPEQYVPAWQATRYAMTDTEGNVIDKGDPPSEWYTFALECASHEQFQQDGWPACCTRAFYDETKWGAPRARCWGEYRPPNDFDLMVIKQAYRKMESEKYRSPYEPMTRAELEETEAAAGMQVERANEQLATLEADMSRDFIKQHGWRLTETDPGVLHHGRFHDMGAKRTESGLIVPS